MLWRVAEGVERKSGKQYKFVLWTRDDAHWLFRPSSLHSLSKARHAASTVFSRNCKTWYGINDKTVLLGRTAARFMLTAYTSFWSPDQALDDTFNSEIYLMRLANLSGLELKAVEFSALPSVDAVIGNQSQICLVPEYSCIEPNVTRGDPPFCAWQHKSLLNMRNRTKPNQTNISTMNYSSSFRVGLEAAAKAIAQRKKHSQ